MVLNVLDAAHKSIIFFLKSIVDNCGLLELLIFYGEPIFEPSCHQLHRAYERWICLNIGT